MIAAPIFVLVIKYTGFQGCRVAGAILPSSATETFNLPKLLSIRIATQCRIRIGNIVWLPRNQLVLLSRISRPTMLDFCSYFISLNMPDFGLQCLFIRSCHFVETSMAKKVNKLQQNSGQNRGIHDLFRNDMDKWETLFLLLRNLNSPRALVPARNLPPTSSDVKRHTDPDTMHITNSTEGIVPRVQPIAIGCS